ncbi:hypothetical protein LOTGIDRAFT_175401 [Lottia gigantea]|uniref:CXXC-type domain-containing protein n=1 Tax=Lottia gigantea TaxID=225164 RepID=V4BZP6_LOTGI|nr:hypothetical protein LOTGIDRAFT_175401 [Lottia gigantea]ESO94629.1 hypothetical protein LOTGIDRAFT_175401 [Lottia gigantea]
MDSDEDTKDGIIVHPDDPVPWFPSQEEDQSLESDHPDKPARLKRRKRCGQCGPCQIRTNCGECSNCLRRSVLKQSCIYRKCIYLRKPVSGSSKTPPRRANGTYFMSSSCDDDLDSSYELMSPPRIDINGFSVGETANGDDTEILIEDYTPTPSIIIGGFDDDPQDSQPSSPIRISMYPESLSQSSSISTETRMTTPPHPMDCEDDASCVNPRQFNALKAIKEAESSSARTETPENMPNVTSVKDVFKTTCEPYSLDVVQNGMKTISEQDAMESVHGTSTENSSYIQSAFEKDQLLLKSCLRQRPTRLSESYSVISQQLSRETPVNSDVNSDVNSEVNTQLKPNNQTDTVSGADSNENITGSVRLPVLQPAQVPQQHLPNHPSSESQTHHEQTAFHNFHVHKPQSISATYDEAHRQFFSPPNVTVTGHGGFASPNSTHESSGSQNHKGPPTSYGSHDYDQYSGGAHPAWYPGISIHPHAYPQFNMPRGMYPPHYAYDPMVFPIHPTQNPFHRFGSHPINPVILPRMVPPRFYPYRRHPGEHQYHSNSPASDPDFSKHPDFRKSSSSVSRPNSGNGQTYDLTSVREEIEQYKKHSVFRLRANSLEKPGSPIEKTGERRLNRVPTPEVASESDVSEMGRNSELSSIPKNRNNALRQLLSHTSTMHGESHGNSVVDDDLQNEMRKIQHNSCNVGIIDELRMPSLVRGDAINIESSSPNSSNSSESVSFSPLLVENCLKNQSSIVFCSEQAPKSVKIQGNVCIKQDLGDEGIVMLEFQGYKVDLVQCVLDDDILKLSNNPQELKEYITKSQSINKTISNPTELPVQSYRTMTEPAVPNPVQFPIKNNQTVTEALNLNRENFPPCEVEDTSKGVLALVDICSSLDRQPPQLQKLGEIVAEKSENPTPPASESNNKETEGWKQSYLKIFSIRQQGTENTKHLANSKKNQVVPAAKSILNCSSTSDCRSEKWTNFIRYQNISVTPIVEAGHENINKSDNSQISDQNIFNSNLSSVESSETEEAKTLNSESGSNPLKRTLGEIECQNSDSKRLKAENNLQKENGNEKMSVKSNTIVRNLTKFVENTIVSYTNEEAPVIVSQCDSILMSEDYQTEKVSARLMCNENKIVSSDQEHEFLSEKTIVELKKKILNRNS